MKSYILCGALLSLITAPSAVRAELVYDSTQAPPGGVYWWYGMESYQENGSVIQLGGTSRWLQSVTLHDFTTMSGGTFDITASIYAVPPVINDNDVLSNPLWSETVQKTFTGSGGLAAYDVDFTGPTMQLADQIVLDFSFTAESGQGAMLCQNLNPVGPLNPPAVGQIASLANYEGWDGVPAGWYNYPPDSSAFLYAQGKITAAAVPDPTTILPLCFGLVGLNGLWRVRRK
jgi:hypothetical protein